MSPEQVSEGASAVDHRSDQYSLGATLFELVVLKPFIDGEGSSEILTKIAFRTPSRSSHCNPAVPAMLDAILCRATARDPQARYATASELADDLSQFWIGQQTTTLDASQSKRSNLRIRRVRVGIAAQLVKSRCPAGSSINNAGCGATSANWLGFIGDSGWGTCRLDSNAIFLFMDFRGALAECRLNLAAAAVSDLTFILLSSALTALNDLSVQEGANPW